MPNPKDVYNNPHKYENFITADSDDNFEGQFFDRKRAGYIRDNGRASTSNIKSVRESICECISAFNNTNHGLVAVGISEDGDVIGIDHLTEKQSNILFKYSDILQTYSESTKHVKIADDKGNKKTVAFIYADYVENYISETKGSEPKAWLREGSQNNPLSWDQRKQLEREKGIENYEESFCCDFDEAEVDEQVIREFRQSFPGTSIEELDDKEVLYQAGALRKNQSEDFYFTNAGYLFFSSNPRRVRPWAYLRLLRFDEKIQNSSDRGPHNFEKEFDGPITQQIQRFRAFVQESGFFKSYQRRKQSGGFSEEPELPKIAVDEAVVNAIAHRDYAIQRPIEIVKYQDALVVNNPGRIQQRDQQLPDNFTLENYSLNSAPRNPRLIEWLKQMEDSDGQPYVLAISEGTKKMKDEMEELDLPAPEYQHNQTETKLALHNNIEERERRYKSEAQASKSTEFVNLFPIHLFDPEGDRIKPKDTNLNKNEISSYLKDSLEVNGWFIDRSHFGRLTFHLPGSEKKTRPYVRDSIRFYPAYETQIRTYWNEFYLLIDYTLEVKNVQNALQLLGLFSPDDIEGRDAVVRLNGEWHKGRIRELSETRATVQLRDGESSETVQPTDVVPRLSMRQLKVVAQDITSSFNLSQEIKKHSFSGVGAARQRAKKTIEAVESIASTVFPLRIRDQTAELKSSPVSLARKWDDHVFERHTLSEPSVEFRSHSETTNIRDGITQYGTYEDQPNQVTIVPICLEGMRDEMESLLRRLREGKYKYRGSERTFSTKLQADFISTVSDSDNILGECRRLLNNHPGWVGRSDKDRIFLVHTPSDEYSKDDVTAPYYTVKRFLLENGIPCQMVDTPTLEDPDWKDLNLALNITAKCGVTPWVLPNRIPDADVFVGLSYTRKQDEDSRRLMGYSTVFNDYGRWLFYSGKPDVFSYDERGSYFAELTKDTLQRLSLPEAPSICFHYSARFSREDRQTILESAREVRPNGTYFFVSINTGHNLRLYDQRPETDGSAERGTYVKTTGNQILLSTTGYNPFKKSIGTPVPLEISAWREGPSDEDGELDLRSIAVQVFNLTKLNWASTSSVTGEPITTKYASDIAYLTEAFLRQDEQFELHPSLEDTPWFL